MVRFNETLLVGISLLAALVLSKGRESVSSLSNIPFIDPFTNLLSKAQAQAIEKQETNIETLENIRQSNLGIAQDILDYEKNISNVKINQLQTELDKTQSFISQQQKIPAGSTLGLSGTGQSLLKKFNDTFNYYSRVWTGEKGPLNQVSIFPDVYIPLNQSTRAAFAQQAEFEKAQERIATANELVFRQQGEIDRLQEEYQTRYGNLSRYG
jgi:hypothetical protein